MAWSPTALSPGVEVTQTHANSMGSECQLKGLAAEEALEKTCFSVNSWLGLTADPNGSLSFSSGTLLHPDARFHDHY